MTSAARDDMDVDICDDMDVKQTTNQETHKVMTMRTWVLYNDDAGPCVNIKSVKSEGLLLPGAPRTAKANA